MTVFNLKIENPRGDEDELYLLLTAKSQTGVTGLTLGVSTKLSDFKASQPDMTIGFDTIDSGRLYVGYGDLSGTLDPSNSQYYGWIEFSKKSSDKDVWVNLSNVDMFGLPLTLAGTDSSGGPFSLGYKDSHNAIVKTLKSSALTSPSAAAVITCTTGQTKIVAPDQMPDCYPSYDNYLSVLTGVGSSLTITSDTPKGGSAKVFTGSFLNAQSDKDPIIHLTSEDGDTFEILKDQFTSEIIYQCSGGTLIYNGTTYEQNSKPKHNPYSVITNSVFRDLVIGINEAYFTVYGPNLSSNFPYLFPFQMGQGSAYAKIIHETSNAYGFPYADDNLKALVTADPADIITLSIIKDDVAYQYDDKYSKGPNMPTSGHYEFGIGTGSETLGTITIGNCRYLPSNEGAYGGFLPTVENWTDMSFEGAGKSISFNTNGPGHYNGSGTFDPAPTWETNPDTGHRVLTWGANVS